MAGEISGSLPSEDLTGFDGVGPEPGGLPTSPLLAVPAALSPVPESSLKPIPTPIPPSAKSRVPPEVDGIQVNFCKNPLCDNFGVSPKPSSTRGGIRTRGVKAVSEPGDYAVVAAGKGIPMLSCKLCGEYPTIKSNLGIAEELSRIVGYLYKKNEASCRNPACLNHGVGISAGTEYYYAFGLTDIGSKRYRCRKCNKTFSVGASTRRQRLAHKNREIFMDLMNKVPLSRICELTGVSFPTLYDKIDFIHKQCHLFVAERERELMEGKPLPKLYISVDRQEYMVNWNFRKDRRTIRMGAVGSADLETEYVFGMNLNFDSMMTPDAVEADAIKAGDYIVSLPHRRYARLWLLKDYDAAIAKSAGKKKAPKDVLEAVADEYATGEERADVEVSESKDKGVRLPSNGMLVHSEYTLYAHFMHLKRLLPGAEKYRFFLDQDSGMRAACFSAFHTEVSARKADAFYVRIEKEWTVSQKRAAIKKSKDAFKRFQLDNPALSPEEVKVRMMEEELARMATIGPWADKWAMHPLPSSSEPEKAMCYLTDYADYDKAHTARLYLKATLHPIDRFFMQVRRRLSVLERPIGTPRSAGRTWFGYSAYRPETIVKMLDIFRVYYNYCLAGEDKKTPAMRLGLAKGVIDPQDVLYFTHRASTNHPAL